MNYSEKNKVTDAKGVTIGMVSPDGRTGMIKHAEQFAKKKIPFIFDPGQGMPMFNGDDLRKFIDQATWVTVNDYEWELLKDRTGWSEKDIVARVDALIVTLGGEGLRDPHEAEDPRDSVRRTEVRPGPDGLRRRVPRRACCTACSTTSTGRRRAASRASWARSRSSTRARRTTQFTLEHFKKRYKAAFGQKLK